MKTTSESFNYFGRNRETELELNWDKCVSCSTLGMWFSSFANQNCLTAEHFGGARIGSSNWDKCVSCSILGMWFSSFANQNCLTAELFGGARIQETHIYQSNSNINYCFFEKRRSWMSVYQVQNQDRTQDQRFLKCFLARMFRKKLYKIFPKTYFVESILRRYTGRKVKNLSKTNKIYHFLSAKLFFYYKHKKCFSCEIACKTFFKNAEIENIFKKKGVCGIWGSPPTKPSKWHRNLWG